MEYEDRLSNLKAIAEHLRQDPRIKGVYLEYPGYLSVMINEEREIGVSYGYSLDTEEQTQHLFMTWNSQDPYAAFSGQFDTKIRPEANAQALLTQIEENGIFNL
jgi:hypothetical protein